MTEATVPYNGSGVFSILNTFVPNTTILSSAMNANFTDVATGLSTAVLKNGTQTITADIPMFGFTFTGLGATTIAATSTSDIPLTLQTTDSSASGGPALNLVRVSSSPAAADVLGQVNWYGKNSAASTVLYGQDVILIIDPTNGSEDAKREIFTMVAGAQTLQVTYGPGIVSGAATGGAQGTGTVNATDYYDDGVKLMSSANSSFSAHKNGSDQTVSTGIQTDVTWSTEIYDTGSNFAANVWTPPAGKVSMSCGLSVQATTVTLVVVTIQKNGADFKRLGYFASAGTSVDAFINIQDSANGTDAYKVTVTATGTGTIKVLGVSTDTFFMGSMI